MLGKCIISSHLCSMLFLEKNKLITRTHTVGSQFFLIQECSVCPVSLLCYFVKYFLPEFLPLSSRLSRGTISSETLPRKLATKCLLIFATEIRNKFQPTTEPTYLPTSCSTFLHDRILVRHLLNEMSVFYGTRRSITALQERPLPTIHALTTKNPAHPCHEPNKSIPHPLSLPPSHQF